MAEPNRTHDSALDAPIAHPSEAALLVELMQLRSLSHDQAERIHQLEQALDQSLESIEELRRRIVNQEFLESQLAATEEIANVQQQAIGRLKLQLEQKSSEPKSLEFKSSEPKFGQASALQDLMATMEAFVEAQQTELQALRSRLAHDRADHQQKRWGTGGQTEGQSVSPASSDLLKPTAPASVVAFKIKVEELNQSKHLSTQALLQHTCQELEAERDRQQIRLGNLEVQAAEMQEQILQQAQQITEQETAVQHWKDRYLSYQEQTQHLAHLLQSLVLPPEVMEILTGLQAPSAAIDPILPVVVRQSVQLDLPEFLMRRRSYAPRRTSPAD